MKTNFTSEPTELMKMRNLETEVQQLIDSERMLKDLMGNIPGMVYRCRNDKAWTMIYLNENCKELTGYDVNDLLQNNKISYQELIHDEDSEMVWEVVQDAIALRERFEITYRINTPDEGQKWVWEKGKGIFNNKGEFLYVEGFISDITRQKESELKYRETIESAVDGILLGNQDGIITHANSSMLKISGRSLNEIKGKHVSVLFKKKELDTFPLRFDLLKKGDTVIRVRNLVKPDGREVPIEMHSKLMPNNTLQAIVRDVSERDVAEKSILKSEEKFRTLAETSAVAIMMFQGDKWVYSNPAGEKISGYSQKELLKMNYWDFIHPEDMRMVKLHGERVKTGKGRFSSFSFRIINKKGKIRWLFLQGDVIDYQGKQTALVSILDMTDQKLAELDLKESEFKYRNLFNKSKDPTLLIDEFSFIDCNKAAVDILKFKKKDEIFKKHPGGLSPEFQPDGRISAEKANEMMQIALKKGYHRFEWVHLTTTGETFPVDVSLTRIPVKGKVMLYTVWRDISERKQAEIRQQVLYNISNAALSLESLEEVYLTVKHELGRLINTSNIFIALYDDKTDLLSIPFMVDKKDRYKTLPKGSLSAYVVKTKKPLLATRKQLDDLAKTGVIKQIGSRAKKWLGVPLMYKGKAIGVIVVQDYENENAFQKSDMELLEFVSRQISISVERKRFEDELKRAFEKASEADRLKSAFLATMSHELRTPLNAIIGFSDLINEKIPIEDAYSFASTINKSGNHLLDLVEDIFDITLIETGEVKVHKTEFNLHLVLNDLVKILKTEQNRMVESNAEIRLNIPQANSNLMIYTDRQKFNQILMNLLKNALKFTPAGVVEFGYTQKVKNNKPVLQFYVKDSGIGIPKKMQSIIFDMFRQVDESYTRAHGGAGIGLSLTKKLTEILGGNIWLESKVGKGSTFYFTIVDFKPLVKGIGRKTTEVDVLKIPDKTILVVEDDESSYELLEVLLKALDAKILWSKNGLEAIELIKENPSIDLVLMDINMPVLNGFEATRSIKKLRPKLPVYAQTAYAISGDKEKALAAGCDEYLEKPIRKKELYKLLNKHLKVH